MSDSEELPVKLPDQIFLGRRYFCRWCDGEIEGFKDKLSMKAFWATGKCQNCQNIIFKRKGVRS
jgi:hypothetical protein